jgi:hypothetical protein
MIRHYGDDDNDDGYMMLGTMKGSRELEVVLRLQCNKTYDTYVQNKTQKND